MSSFPLETELFYYEHLFDSSDNLRLIQDFCVSNTSAYEEEKFVHQHIKPKYDKGCIFMYQLI